MTTAAAHTIAIADDEPLARDRLRRLLLARPSLRIVGEWGDGRSLLEELPATGADILLLDIRMPELDGLEVASELAARMPRPPVVVFVTAFDEHAVAAFEVGGVDYLLKPVSEEGLDRALARAQAWLGRGDDRSIALAKALEQLARQASPMDRIPVRDSRGVYFVNVDDVWWVEADGNYARLHTPAKTHLVRATMAEMERRLPASAFIRVHRCYIVRLDRIRRIDPEGRGEYLVHLEDGARVSSSRAYGARLRMLLTG